jgi:hypothetical protein
MFVNIQDDALRYDCRIKAEVAPSSPLPFARFANASNRKEAVFLTLLSLHPVIQSDRLPI